MWNTYMLSATARDKRVKRYDVKNQGCFNWACLIVIRSMHSKILFCAAQEWSGSGSHVLLKEYSTCLLPYKLTMCLLVTKVSPKSLRCVCLLPKCSLKAYNVSSCYKSVSKSFTNERPLEYMLPKCPFFVTKHPHVWNNHMFETTTCLKQPWSFYSVVTCCSWLVHM